MARLMVIGAAAMDRPIWLSGAPRPGGRLQGSSIDGQLGARLGGGGANAAVALRKAGHQVRLIAVPARQGDGAEALRRAAAAGLDVGLSVMRDGVGSTTLLLLAPDGERLVLSLDGEPGPTPPIPAPAADDPWRPAGLLVRAAYQGADAWAAATAGPVILHMPSAPFIGRVDVIVASADDLSPDVRAAPYDGARASLSPRQADDLRWVVVTQGAGGATAHGPASSIWSPAAPAAPRDATGAGDIFAAGLLDALSAGADMERALIHACAWGATAVGLDGSAPTDAAQDLFRAWTAS